MLDKKVVEDGLRKLKANLSLYIRNDDVDPIIETWREELRYWGNDEFEEVIKYFIAHADEGTKLPTISKLKYIYYNELVFDKKTLLSCDKCNNEGIRRFKEMHDGVEYEYVAACDCEHGRLVKRRIPDMAFYKDVIQRSDGEEIPF